MRLYSPDQQEKIHVRRETRKWERSGLITKVQRERFEQGTDPGVKRVNLFMRLLLFVFTSVCLYAVIGFTVWLLDLHDQTANAYVVLLYGFPVYFFAEYLVKRNALYRYGAEEALALNAVILIAAGAVASQKWLTDHSAQTVILCLLICGGNLWLYFRFGFLYAVLIALISMAVIPFNLHLAPSSERMLLFALFVLGLIINILADKRAGMDFQKRNNGFIQSFLILGMYLAVNLRIISLAGILEGRYPTIQPNLGLPPSFYWATYIIVMAMPVLVLVFGVVKRRRAFIDTGLLIALITIVVNKDYLGLKHYAWDAAILGILLIGIALIALRLLKNNKQGFTSENILKPEEHGIDLAMVTAFAAPSGGVPGPTDPFSGGQSGGAGASRDY